MPRKKKRKHGSGSVFQRKSDGRWVGKYKKYKPIYGSSRAEVQAKLDELVRTTELESMEPKIINEATVEEFLTTWLRTVERAHLKPKSYDRKEQSIRLYVIPRIGSIPVSELKSRDVQAMVTDMIDQGFSLSTIRQAVFSVSAAYKWGRSQDPPLTDLRPTAGITMPTVQTLPPEVCTYFTQEEAESLIEAAYEEYSEDKPRYRYGAAVELIINTGLRQGELLALRWDDVDPDYKKITVRHSTVHVRDYQNENDDTLPNYRYVTQESAKTRSGRRVIKCNKAAQHALWVLQCQAYTDWDEWTKQHPHWTDDVKSTYELFQTVLSTKTGHPVRERAFMRSLEAIGKRAAIIDSGGLGGKRCSAHPLRHTFATLYLYGKGPGARGDVKTLSILLGHRDVSTTYNIYAHYLDDLESEDKVAVEITEPAGETVEEATAGTVVLESNPVPNQAELRAEINREATEHETKTRKENKRRATVK